MYDIIFDFIFGKKYLIEGGFVSFTFHTMFLISDIVFDKTVNMYDCNNDQ